MSVAVAFAVTVERLVVRNEFFQFCQQIVAHIRIRVLVDRYACRRVRTENMTESALQVPGDPGTDPAGDVDHFTGLLSLKEKFRHRVHPFRNTAMYS